ncbi:UDP-N-acetylmuramoyl-L-alanine--D-glutamate ligase [Methylibium sp.]|uniref:UDP-N-acetylmuramoyl-L-alanine--D-glutamate ligase n=1 Tax=Methylibium sp. TaxID=2067992 RepID=UPI003D102E83
MNALQDQTVLVLGLGDSGLAMAQWCARGGALVRVADTREAPPQAAALAQHVPGATLSCGFDAGLLDGVQRVLKSPGLSPLDPALAPLLARAAELGVPVEGELDLFAQALTELKAGRGYAPKVIAITGTNGKTTTTVMCGQLVERSGLRVAVAGNVGPTMLGTLAAALDQEGEMQAVLPSPQPSPAGAGEGADPAPLSPAPSPAPVGEGRGEGSSPDEPPDDEDAPLQLASPPPAAPVFEHLPEAWVLELSSFQLDGVRGFVPSAAVVLNVTQDHLDWHGSMAAYAAAKARIYGPADARDCTMVVNRDDPQVEAMVPAPLPQKGRLAKPLVRKVIRFGLDAPQRPGDYGLVVEHGMAWLVRALEADETLRRRKSDEPDEIHLQRLMPADALRIRGRHNAANALAALALATAIGRPLAPMLHGLREYGGEPHRVELIATVGGVEAYDDSKGTNVGATVAALDGLGADKAPAKLVVILGGDGKGQDFTPLAAPVARHARAVALIGRDAAAIEAVLEPGGVPLARHDTLQAATRWCFGQARAGDAVLLSPACASLDMFRNYAQRAAVFGDEVRDIAHEQGETA